MDVAKARKDCGTKCAGGRGNCFWQEEHLRCLAAIGVAHCCYF